MNRNPRASEMPECCQHCDQSESPLCQRLRDGRMLGPFPARQRRYDRDETIYAAGQTPGLIGVLRAGVLRQERMLAEGRRTIFTLSLPGEIIGLMPGHVAMVSAEAATDVELCLFDDRAVRALVSGGAPVRWELLAQARSQRDLQLELVSLRGALNSRERVIAFLVLMTAVMPTEPAADGSLTVTVPLSRRDWADLSNTSVETVSRTMTALAEDGTVTTLEANRYRIADLGRLAALAGLEANDQPGQHPVFPALSRTSPGT